MSLVSITNKELDEVVEKLLGAVDGMPVTTVTMGCIATAIMLQSPEANLQEIGEGLQEVSRFIVSFIDKRHPRALDTELPASQLN